MNSNVGDPKVNNGEWRAIALSFNSELRALNCNSRDSKVNDGESKA
ncbi:hypothetical protein [Nostoc sp. DSM 114160]